MRMACEPPVANDPFRKMAQRWAYYLSAAVALVSGSISDFAENGFVR
jgi:hypothetical protein